MSEEKAIQPQSRACAACGKEFQAENPSSIYCSGECRLASPMAQNIQRALDCLDRVMRALLQPELIREYRRVKREYKEYNEIQ